MRITADYVQVIGRTAIQRKSRLEVLHRAIQDYAYSGTGCRGGKHGGIFYDEESSAIKSFMEFYTTKTPMFHCCKGKKFKFRK